MFVHAEEFDTRRAARARYLQITGRLRAERDRDLACYNLLYQSTRPVVAIIAPEAPPADVLAGRSGKTVELPREFWETLAQRHRRGASPPPSAPARPGTGLHAPGGPGACSPVPSDRR